MTGKPWSADEDELLIALDKSGIDIGEIASQLKNRTLRAVYHRRNALNLPKRNPVDVGRNQHSQWIQDLEVRLGEPIARWLSRRYVDEKATYRELTTEAGINTRSLMKLMKLSKIEPITGTEAVLRQMGKDPEKIARLVRAGHTPEAGKKRAQWREANWKTFCSKGELRFLRILNDNGLNPVPQFAVETFNIDFAFPECMIAVEYDPRWHNSGKKLEADKRKELILNNLGWTVIHLDTRASNGFNINKILSALKSFDAIQPPDV